MTVDEIIDISTGYANGFDRVLSETGMNADKLTEILLEHSVEQCPNCEWYTESFLLLDDEGEPDGYCDNCRIS